MSNWLNDVQPFPTHENGAFNTAVDPSMAFMQATSSPGFDSNQMQNQHLQQRMQNGIVRNGSPAYHNPMYPTQPVVPSKRPRPREDSIGASPRQPSEALPGSRSQTPQGAYPGYQGAVNGSQQFTGTPYQQFQQGGNNANQSPVVNNHGFNSQMAHQRLQTMSPSPFSPASQNFGAHTSPTHSEHGSRVGTPQDGGQQYAQPMPYGGPGQQFTPQLASAVNGTPMSQYNQQALNHQRANEVQARQLQLQQQLRQPGAMVNSLARPSNQQMNSLRAQQLQQQAQQRTSSPEQLLRAITNWMQQKNMPFNPQPMITGRHVTSIQLFYMVMKHHGSRAVTAASQWPRLAQMLGYPQPLWMSAGQELQSYYHTNLAPYENFMRTQQQQQAQQRALADPTRALGHTQGAEAVSRQDAFSPTKQMHSLQAQLMQPPSQMHPPYQTPTKNMSPRQHDARHALQNGHMAQPRGHAQGRPSNVNGMQQAAKQISPPAAFPQESPPRNKVKRIRDKRRASSPEPWTLMPTVAAEEINEQYGPKQHNLENTTNQKEGRTTHGGMTLTVSDSFLDTMKDLLNYKLSVPRVDELGVIDIRALTLSLRSGIHAEVRLALDTLATLSREINPLPLKDCEDLVETMIECADEQIELLAEHAAEVSDDMLINSYEDSIRSCKIENMSLHEDPEFGTLEYELDRAVDRLICITTILRNYSFLEANLIALTDPIVTRMLATVIRYLGTRNMLLRSHNNALDFSKDAVIFLSNVCGSIELPGKEETLSILNFLLSFAPLPGPNSMEQGEITFTAYSPEPHRYYSPAVDALAKLLARGDPNRTFFRIIFTADSPSPSPNDLLSRAFGLAVAAVPGADKGNFKSIVRIRAPHVVQGLLAAEILASLIPSSEHELARSWLSSKDGFALNLMRIIIELSKESQHQPLRHHPGMRIEPDGSSMVIERGLAVLRRLAEKAKDAGGLSKGLPFGLLPDKRSVISILQAEHMDRSIVRQLSALLALDS